MKKIYFFILFIIPALAIAQIDDRTETNCEGISKSVYAVGNSGKPLLIASDGFDCSICQSHAGPVRDFANANEATIEVWGAMSFLYANDTPDCEAVSNWNNTYNWTTIFTFPDVEDYWFGSGAPTYYVIHPNTHEITYQGPNRTNAFNAALALVTITGINEEPELVESLTVYANGVNLKLAFNALKSGNTTIDVMNIVGQKVAEFNQQINEGLNDINLSFDANAGVYIIRFAQNGIVTSRKIYRSQIKCKNELITSVSIT